MTQQQLDAYLESTGYGISSDDERVAYISNFKGDVVAMYWRGRCEEHSYLETLEEPIQEQQESDALNLLTWNSEQWHDALLGVAVTAFILAWCLFVIAVFK